MNRTENQTTTWSGVAAFSTHAPITTPPMRGGYPYGSSPKTAGPSHNLTAIIGATVLAVLMIVMAGIAMQRSNDAVVAATVVAAATVPQEVVVPHGAAAELADAMAYVPSAVSAVAAATVPQTVVVPHGALPVE